MSESSTSGRAPVRSRRSLLRSRRARALSAGALVLGVGVATSLATFSDAVKVNGTFDTGRFDLQGTRDGVEWRTKNSVAETRLLFFETDATKMYAGSTSYAAFSVATSPKSDYDGTVVLANVTHDGGGLESVLTYKIYAVSDTGSVGHGAHCSPTDRPAATTLWQGGNAARPGNPANDPSWAGKTLPVSKYQGANGGVIQRLCIAVTMGDPTATTAANEQAVQAALTSDPSPESHGTRIVFEFSGTSRDLTTSP